MIKPGLRFIVLLNHDLTPAQIADARDSLGVEEIVETSENVRQIWKNLPPNQTCLTAFLQPVFDFVRTESRKGDYLLVQGDFGAVFLLVAFAFALGLRPVYSTTERNVEEIVEQLNSVTLHRTFKHCIFRNYEKFEAME